MSLLMDALKKAEEAKRRAEAAASDAGGTAPSVSGGHDEQARLPEISDRLELVDEQLAASHSNASPREGAADTQRPERPSTNPSGRAYAGPMAAERDDEAALQRQRDAARTLFAAKQPASRKNFNWLVGIGTALGLLLVGAYLWFELDQTGKSILVAEGSRAGGTAQSQTTPPPAPPPAERPETTPPPPPPAAPPSFEPPPTTITSPSASPSKSPPPRASVEKRARPAAEPRRRVSLAAESPSPAERRVRTAPQEAASIAIAPEAGDVRLTKHVEAPPNPALIGWQALQVNDLASARRYYAEALRQDRRNVDALLGLASVEQREGHAETAESLLRRALEADPGNAIAQTSLINLRNQGEGGNTESRLKTMVAADPDAHALHFSLGNFYARQGRWTNAQQAYFKAYSLDAGNPDYLYNLAVSLDHLHQPKLALEYYQNALAAARARTAQFNRAKLESRLTELQTGR